VVKTTKSVNVESCCVLDPLQNCGLTLMLVPGRILVLIES
jgi:hypothetical protein